MPTLAELLRGYGETALTLGTGAVAAPVGGAYGVYKNVTSPYYGTQEGINLANQEAEKAMNAMTYQPRGQEGQQNLQTLGQLFKESKLPPIIPEVAGFAPLLRKMPLSSKPTDIGAALEKRRVNDFDTLVKEYAKIADSKGGKTLNTDVARELSPEYVVNRTRSAEVHDPSSDFIKQLYSQKLAEPTPKGVSPTVLFTGGGAGAGKTSAIKTLGLDKDVEMTYDTNMATLDSSVKKIKQALDSGRNAKIVYTYRDPVEALTGGSLSRAVNMKKEYGSGRTVPLEEHMKNHMGSREVVGQLLEMYKDDPRVAIDVIDNSRGAGNQVLTTLDKIPQVTDNGLLSKLNKALEMEYASGRIPKDIYEGSK